MESLQEIVQFLNHDAQPNLKVIALQHVLCMTASIDGLTLLLELPEILKQLIILAQDSYVPIRKNAVSALINITGNVSGTKAILIISEGSNPMDDDKYTLNLVEVCMRAIMDKSSTLADPCCMILSNMSRSLPLLDRLIALIERTGYTWDAIVSAFTAKEYNTKGAKLHYLGSVFNNLSQSSHIRRYLMDRDRSVIQRLLPFTEYLDSVVRRRGIVGTLKNCTFVTENHEWLLSPEVDLLSHLLLPLAGPEEFDDEDNDKLPVSLQYLPETKIREPDADIRLMLLESLNQLCATKMTREILRQNNTYIILREFHKWEKNKSCLLACENVVDILIRTEEEIGLDNLKKVEVPSEYTEKFHEMDQDFIKDT